MKKNKWLAGLIMLLTVLAAVRIYMVNKDVPSVPVTYYQMGDIVPLDHGSGDEKDLKMAGYTIEVFGQELMPVDDFCEKYHFDKTTAGFDYDYLCLVDVTFANHNHEDSQDYGINLYDILLIGKDYYAMVSKDYFAAANPNLPGTSFAIRGDTEIRAVLTYGLSEKTHKKMSVLEKEKPSIIVSDAPLRKIIKMD